MVLAVPLRACTGLQNINLKGKVVRSSYGVRRSGRDHNRTQMHNRTWQLSPLQRNPPPTVHPALLPPSVHPHGQQICLCRNLKQRARSAWQFLGALPPSV